MWRAFALGIVTGLRSQLPTALLAWRQERGELAVPITGVARVLRRQGTVPVLVLAATGELVVDKLPQTPSRLDAGPFFGRVTLGVAAGVAIAGATGRSQLTGGVLGAAGAALGSWLGVRYRTTMADSGTANDAVWALAEDAVAIGVGLAATSVKDG